MKYTIIMEQGPDGGWGAYAPDLPGLVLVGDTRDDLIESARDGIETYLDALREGDLPVPRPRVEAASIEVAEAVA